MSGALLALLAEACSIDLLVAPDGAPPPEPGELAVLQTWGNGAPQEPWTTSWGRPPILSGQLVDPNGAIVVDDAEGQPVVALSIDGANEVAPVFGDSGVPLATLLDGTPGSMTARAPALAGTDIGPAYIGLSASVSGYSVCGRQRGGVEPSLTEPSSAFVLVGGGGEAEHVYELVSNKPPQDVLALGTAHRDDWVYVVGASYNSSFGEIRVDGEPVVDPVFFPDDGPDNRSYPLLLAFSRQTPERALGLQLVNDPSNASAMSELRAVDASGTRVVVAGRAASWLEMLDADGKVVVTGVTIGHQAVEADSFMPVFLELERHPDEADKEPDFAHVWHHPVTESGNPSLRGELGAVRLLDDGSVLACGSYRGSPPAPDCGGDDGGWLVLRHRAGDDGPAECVPLGVDQAGVCTRVAQSADGNVWLGGVSGSAGGAPPHGVLYRLDASLRVTGRLELPGAGSMVTSLAAASEGGIWVVGSFATELADFPAGGARAQAVGGAGDWDFFLARWSL